MATRSEEGDTEQNTQRTNQAFHALSIADPSPKFYGVLEARRD